MHRSHGRNFPYPGGQRQKEWPVREARQPCQLCRRDGRRCLIISPPGQPQQCKRCRQEDPNMMCVLSKEPRPPAVPHDSPGQELEPWQVQAVEPWQAQAVSIPSNTPRGLPPQMPQNMMHHPPAPFMGYGNPLPPYPGSIGHGNTPPAFPGGGMEFGNPGSMGHGNTHHHNQPEASSSRPGRPRHGTSTGAAPQQPGQSRSHGGGGPSRNPQASSSASGHHRGGRSGGYGPGPHATQDLNWNPEDPIGDPNRSLPAVPSQGRYPPWPLPGQLPIAAFDPRNKVGHVTPSPPESSSDSSDPR
ncbi:hypothetical protein C8R46DRAFT_1040952 [Mycena filopes]|nr:hypothetical protein C8R46DRAFT_1040952 [Mycena filopes]